MTTFDEENRQKARQLGVDVYQGMQHAICTSLDSDELWEAAARLGHAIILDHEMAPQLEEFIRVQLPQLVLQYIANDNFLPAMR